MLLGKSDHALIPDKIHWSYGAKDADATRRIRKPLVLDLEKEGLKNYYENFIIPTARNLLKSSLIGIYIDDKKFRRTSRFLKRVLKGHLKEIEEHTYEGFNPASPQQLASFLFDDLGLDSVKSTASGARSTDEEVITQLWETTQHPFLDVFREYKKLAKLQSTYINPVPILLDSVGFIHPNWQVTGTKTGRIISRDPGTTTAPRDKDYIISGEEVPISIRSMYSCPPGYKLAYWDKKQGELRCLAVVAGDQAFLDVFESREDPHEEAARQCLEITGTISKEQRVISKAVQFGIIYGSSEEGLAANTGAALEVVKAFMRAHRRRFPTTHKYLDSIGDIAFDDGYLESPFGRRKHVVPVARGDNRAHAGQIREFRNFIPQNACAQIVASEYNRVCKRLEEGKLGKYTWPNNIVYDACTVVYKKEHEDQVKDIILEEVLRPVPEMEDVIFPVSFGIGNNWSEAEKTAEDIYEY